MGSGQGGSGVARGAFLHPLDDVLVVSLRYRVDKK